MSFASNARDLSRFLRIFLARDSGTPGRVLGKSSIEAMLSPQSESIARNQGLAVGLPWLLDPPELAYLGRGAWYAGKYLGHRVCVMLLPELRLGALALCNSWAWGPEEGLRELCAEFLRIHAFQTRGLLPRDARLLDGVIPFATLPS